MVCCHRLGKERHQACILDARAVEHKRRRKAADPQPSREGRHRPEGSHQLALAMAMPVASPYNRPATYFYCVTNAIGLQVVGAATDSMDIARGILRARR
jgi:hypothetical protein